MYRNNYTNNTTTSTVTSSDKNDTIYYIVTANVDKVKKLVLSSNVNQIIDNRNGYTALHYAIQSGNKELIDYMMSIGANTNIRTSMGHDAYDISLQYHNRNLIDNVLFYNNKTINELKSTVSSLEEKNRVSENRISYLTNLSQESENSKRKIDALTTENIKLKDENQRLTDKYNKLDASYEGLLKRSRK